MPDPAQDASHARWSEDRAWAWHREQPWLCGCNFVPSTAASQLEMWQAATFDPEAIDRELGWAANLGMNAVRVYLHDLPWRTDREAFLERVDRFLDLADRHAVRTMLVLFDGVWNPRPQPGPQPEPRPRVHNAGWVQSPGMEILANPERHDEVAEYATEVVRRFGSDPRVVLWDVMNEPDNPYLPDPAAPDPEAKAENALLFLAKAFGWVRAVGPTQPLTAAVWRGDWSDPAALSPIDRFQLEHSDVVSFHGYLDAPHTREWIAHLEAYGRPLVCSEYLARTQGSTFEAILPIFAEKRIGAFCWGLVAGRTQTIYPWDSWVKAYDAEPDPWFHDVLRPDGTPYRTEEAETLRRLTRAARS